MTQDIFHTIARRKSWRTFSGLLPGADIMRALLKEAAEAPLPIALAIMPEGTQVPCIRLIEQKSGATPPSTYGVVKGARLYAAMAFSPEASRAEAVLGGIMFERFVLRATALGMATCWLGGTFGRSSFQQLFDSRGGTGTVAYVSPVGHEAPSMRIGERIMRTVVRASSRRPFIKTFLGATPPLQFPPALPLPAETTPAQIASLLFEAVRLAPSSSNSQPWSGLFTFHKGSCGITLGCRRPDGRFATADMGIALCHLFLAAEALGVELLPGNADFNKLSFHFYFR